MGKTGKMGEDRGLGIEPIKSEAERGIDVFHILPILPIFRIFLKTRNKP